MKKYIRLTVVLALMLLLASIVTGCATAKETPAKLNLPEAEDIQAVLTAMSKAVVDKNQTGYMSAFSENCLRRDMEETNFKSLTGKLAVNKYSLTLTKAKRINGGTVCTVEIYQESQSSGKKNTAISSRDAYFIYENNHWRIADYDFYPLKNPDVVVGSDSVLYEEAAAMSEALEGRLSTDKNYLQRYGDTILVGTAYDNASILDLEQKEKTAIKVTDDYPGSDIGIVQVLSGIDNYRFVICIQGSSPEIAKSTILYMTRYLKQNMYLNAGVYFFKDDRLKKAEALELTTLTTLDMEKTESRLVEVQKNIEANIAALQEELKTENDQLLRIDKNLHNPYQEDYSAAFAGSTQSNIPFVNTGMEIIPSDFTDYRLCTWAFSLPRGNNEGTLYSYSRFMGDSLLDSDQPHTESAGIFASGETKLKTAGDLYVYNESGCKIAGDPYSIASFNTAMLRLLGLSREEIFNCILSDRVVNFANISSGYLGISEKGSLRLSQKLSSGELRRLENDTYFIDFDNSTSNLEADKAISYLTAVKSLIKLEKDISRSTAADLKVDLSDLNKNISVLNNTQDIYGMLKDVLLIDEDPCIYPSLDEAKAELLRTMGQLLALKNTELLANSAAAYPGSQYDFARYAAGLANVEYPNAYAAAAVKSKKVQAAARGISDASASESDKLQQLLKFSEGIQLMEGQNNRFTYPDTCITRNSSTAMDKALLLFGVYKNLYQESADIYVALGQESSYLAFNTPDGWEFIDCKDNTQSSYINDTIYLCFNEAVVYNSALELGDKPDFIQ